MIYFWSDTHFNHEGIIALCKRGYKTIEEMNKELIRKWNAIVRPEDTIYHLGDFGFSHWKGRPLEEIFAELSGHKHLVIGNHDEKNAKVLKLPWESMNHMITVRDNGRRIVACHYPFESWKGMYRNYVHVHGHCHGQLKRHVARRYDMGVDVRVVPMSFDIIYNGAMAEPFQATDGHKIGDL